MAGTKAGALKARDKNKALYGEDYYAKIGAAGGKLGHTGGFGNGEQGRELARRAGRKGGQQSRRGPSKAKAAVATVMDVTKPKRFNIFKRKG